MENIMQLVTLKKHRYRNEEKLVGDKYEITSKSVIVLYKALGWVAELPKELKANEVPSEPKKSWLDSAINQPEAKPKPKPKSKYSRKDMRAK